MDLKEIAARGIEVQGPLYNERTKEIRDDTLVPIERKVCIFSLTSELRDRYGLIIDDKFEQSCDFFVSQLWDNRDLIEKLIAENESLLTFRIDKSLSVETAIISADAIKKLGLLGIKCRFELI